MAFELVFDDLKNHAQNAAAQAETFVSASLAGPMYMLQLLDEQYGKADHVLAAREVMKIMTNLGSLTNEMVKFGSLTDADEIAVYNSAGSLVALYRHNGTDMLIGGYLAKLAERELIPMKPGDDWYIMLTDLQKVPKIPLPAGAVTASAAPPPERAQTAFALSEGYVTLEYVVPISRKDQITGVCMIHARLRQQAFERYSSLSRTNVNLFIDRAFSLGTLPQYDALAAETAAQLRVVDIADGPGHLSPRFARITVGAQEYDQGAVALGRADRPVAVLTVNLPRAAEFRRRNQFIGVVIGITVFFGIVAAVSSSLISAFVARPMVKLTKLLQRLTEGDLEGIERQAGLTANESGQARPAKLRKRAAQDELSLLFYSFHAMVRYLRDMATVADRISRGEIAQQVTPRSANDVLGHAFHRMTTYLNTIAAVATAVAHGDLRHTVTPQSAQDILGQAFQQMRALQQIMRQIEEKKVGDKKQKI